MKEIKFATIELVYIEDKTKTPHCLIHGAMNKMTNFDDKTGIWRCISAVSKNHDTLCRAGCQY